MQVNGEALEWMRVIVAAIRGLAIETMFRRSDSGIAEALHVFETLIEMRLHRKARGSQNLRYSPAASGECAAVSGLCNGEHRTRGLVDHTPHRACKLKTG